MYTHVFDRSKDNLTYWYDTIMPDYHRSDIVLLNATRSGNEYTLHVTKNGFTGDMWLLDILSDEEYQRVQAIAALMRERVKLEVVE